MNFLMKKMIKIQKLNKGSMNKRMKLTVEKI